MDHISRCILTVYSGKFGQKNIAFIRSLILLDGRFPVCDTIQHFIFTLAITGEARKYILSEIVLLCDSQHDLVSFLACDIICRYEVFQQLSDSN